MLPLAPVYRTSPRPIEQACPHTRSISISNLPIFSVVFATLFCSGPSVSSCPWFSKDMEPYRTNPPYALSLHCLPTAPPTALPPPPPHNRRLAPPPSPSPTFFPKERNQIKSFVVAVPPPTHASQSCSRRHHDPLNVPSPSFTLVHYWFRQPYFGLVSVSFVSFVHPTCFSPSRLSGLWSPHGCPCFCSQCLCATLVPHACNDRHRSSSR